MPERSSFCFSCSTHRPQKRLGISSTQVRILTQAEEATMRIPIVSALCFAFVPVSFSHPAAAQVNPGNLQSFQAQHPTTTQQSARGLRGNFADQQATRACCNSLTAPLPNRPGTLGWVLNHHYAASQEIGSCAQCAHIQTYEAPPAIDPGIIVERIPRRLLPLLQPVPPSNPDMSIYHGLQPCPKDFHPFLPTHL